MKWGWLKFLFFCLLIPILASAEIPVEFKKYFQSEQYSEAIESLNSLNGSVLLKGQKAYLKGICYSRLRNYDQAIINFKQAVKEEDADLDLNYEYGQALFANNSLKQARYEFSKSAGKNFNFPASMYYVAYISELLGDEVTAKVSYWKLIKDNRTDKKFLQIAYFQYAKNLLKMMRKEEQSIKYVNRNLITLDINLINYVPRYVLPLLQKAKDIDANSSVGLEVDQTIKVLVEEFRLDPNILSNGRRVSANRGYVNLAQRFKYDNNVAQTKLGSSFFETEAFGKYDFILKKRFVISPEVRVTNSKYNNKKESLVYQFDSLAFSSALRNKYEHRVYDQPASLILDLDYNSLSRDWRKNHSNEYYSKTITSIIGEQFSLINSGETTFKFKKTEYNDQTILSNYKAQGFTVDQYFTFQDGLHFLILTFDMTNYNYYEASLYNNKTYLARLVYLAFEFVPTYTLQFTFSASLTDTMAQKELRGEELSLNPTIDITKALTDKLKLGINYSYTDYHSNQIDYQFKKQVLSLEVNYTF
jgi:tetratricopeptide (TPR) repeat protein